MQIVQLGKGPILFADAHGVALPGLATATVNAIRVWTDRRGKTHFEYVQAQPTRNPLTCLHGGTFMVGRPTRPVAYTWARSPLFDLRCGDCGARLIQDEQKYRE